ncbi:DUF1707 domain-containing protein [Patulibacter brassicae]|uniref:DUF1707 domain-containing protein n=1 Tax=Patulibacter brassicae TaxID=1705717 RepID=A0ABU4VLX0_9ACTN|nr:DUF1707 domain-containing protein [Patulibacter brassicae]MDX8151936.1 DUF1707 domain-containing protein [Patulibacter brassicae]
MVTGGEAPDDAIRASDAERDAAIERLREGAAGGRLTFEELADRIEGAAGARTRGDLRALLGDLPADPPTTPRAAEPAGPVEEHRSSFGDLRRDGRWTVPSRSRWRTILGDVVLDLREAAVAHERIEIEARTVFGDVRLLVPEGIEVHLRGASFFGDLRQDAGRHAPAGAPVIALQARTTFGDVRVQSARLRDRLARLRRG